MLELQNKMEKFIFRGLSMSKDRIYRPIVDGGLGLFRLDAFIASLQCSWIKRCCQLIYDNWRYWISALSAGNPEIVQL
jgi:hypothetical protein